VVRFVGTKILYWPGPRGRRWTVPLAAQGASGP
jgi:hypothetical protein